jgi:hypothetical protein
MRFVHQAAPLAQINTICISELDSYSDKHIHLPYNPLWQLVEHILKNLGTTFIQTFLSLYTQLIQDSSFLCDKFSFVVLFFSCTCITSKAFSKPSTQQPWKQSKSSLKYASFRKGLNSYKTAKVAIDPNS